MKEIDIAENAYHNGYEKGRNDGWYECVEYMKKRIREIVKGDNDGKEMDQGSGDQSD